jgi:hypothetical protein
MAAPLDSVSVEAMDGLSAAIQFFLPAQADANLQPSISVQAVSITPTGLGGFVGINDNPAGEIVGRRIEGTVVVAIKAADATGIDAAAGGAINALLAADRAALLNQGLLRLAVNTVGDSAAGPGTSVQKQIGLGILYEYLKIPTDAGDVIQQIPLNIQLQQ